MLSLEVDKMTNLRPGVPNNVTVTIQSSDAPCDVSLLANTTEYMCWSALNHSLQLTEAAPVTARVLFSPPWSLNTSIALSSAVRLDDALDVCALITCSPFTGSVDTGCSFSHQLDQ